VISNVHSAPEPVQNHLIAIERYACRSLLSLRCYSPEAALLSKDKDTFQQSIKYFILTTQMPFLKWFFAG